MRLSPGTRLGPYEVTAPLGAGGMGEVYRARDTRLDRTVAIKVLPEHLADTPDARQRFEREARAVSALNQVNICTLHDIGRQDGVDYLVMECVEGETLATRLEERPAAAHAGAQIRRGNRRRAGYGAPRRGGAPRPDARQHHADGVGSRSGTAMAGSCSFATWTG